MANSFSIRGSYKSDIGAGLAKDKAAFAGIGAAGRTHLGGLTGAFGKAEKASGKFSGALGHAKGQIAGVMGSIGMLAGVGGVTGLVGVLGESVTAARDFGSAMDLIRNQAGASQSEVESMSKALVDMAGKVGTAPETLATGLYHIESAGIRGSKALDVLTAAAQGAAVGNADLESVTNALIAAVNSGVKGVDSMTGAMGTLNAIVGSGNMKMEDLTAAIGTGILSTAKTFGVSIQSVGAALGDMTNQGIPAIDAANGIRSAMRLMAAPTSTAAKLLAGIGLSSTTLAQDMRGPGGLQAAIVDLQDHLSKGTPAAVQVMVDSIRSAAKSPQAAVKEINKQLGAIGLSSQQIAYAMSGDFSRIGLTAMQQAALLAHAFGGKQSQAILTLVGNMDALKASQDAVANGASDFQSAWERTQQDAGFQWEKFTAIVQADAIKIGDKLLPKVVDGLTMVGGWLDQHGNEIADAFGNAADEAVKIGGAVKDTVVPALSAITGAFNSLPDGVKQLLIGAFVGSRVVKWTFGISAVDVVKGVAGVVEKGVGSLFKNAVSANMNVEAANVNVVGKGGGLPGLPGGGGAAGAVEGGAAAAGGMSLTAIAAGAAAIASIPLAYNLIYALRDQNAPGEGRFTNAAGKVVSTQQALGVSGMTDAQFRQLYAYGQVGNMLNAAAAQSPAAANGDTHENLLPSNQAVAMALPGGRDTHEDLKPTNKLLADLKGLGIDLKNTAYRELSAQERAAQRASKDFEGALGRVNKLQMNDNRRLVSQQMGAALRIAKGTESSAKKVDQLDAIQKDLLKHGDRWAAAQVGKLKEIAAKKTSVAVNINDGGTTVNISGLAAGRQTVRIQSGKYTGKTIPLAKGGVMPADGRALVGEAGRPEIVEGIPGGGFRVTPIAAPAGGGAQSVEFHVHVHGANTPGAMREAAQAFGPLLVRWMQQNGFLTRTASGLAG